MSPGKRYELAASSPLLRWCLRLQNVLTMVFARSLHLLVLSPHNYNQNTSCILCETKLIRSNDASRNPTPGLPPARTPG